MNKPEPTLRDQFALAAMHSMIVTAQNGKPWAWVDTTADLAVAAYDMADAMLEARKP